MVVYQGKSVSNGIAIGKIKIWKKQTTIIEKFHIEDPDLEYDRFLLAKEEAVSQLNKLYEKALNEAGCESAEIFEIHTMLLSDEDFLHSINDFIFNEKLNVEYAISKTGEIFYEMFSSMNDPYMKARATDIKDISERLLKTLSKDDDTIDLEDNNIILVAQDLSPSETMQFDKSHIVAFVTVDGSYNSHTAILSRTMGIPSISGCDLFSSPLAEGKTAVVDGFEGKVYLEPDNDFLSATNLKLSEIKEKKEQLSQYKGRKTVTPDGKEVMLFANIGDIKDLPSVLECDAEGIGLFRSEFIFLERERFPSEEEQFAIYKKVAETMSGKKVIIRTLDIGADKKVGYFSLEQEENPALGLRGIRLCLKRTDIFKTQLRALLRASVFGDIHIMYPMISSLSEIKSVKKIVAETALQLEKEKSFYKVPPQGIMIETPAAALLSKELAEEVSFFSIGTNDLSQYTMAMDRQNAALDEFIKDSDDAVFKLIEMTVNNAHEKGIWVGICGEAAADLSLTQKFLHMGVDELSVSPSSLLWLREKICTTNIN